MKFRTDIQIPPSEIRIDHKTSILSVGSCFADRIGERLSQSKFRTLINPGGVIFNPVSVNEFIKSALTGHFESRHLINSFSAWYSYDFHSSIREEEPGKLKEKFGAILGEAGSFLRESQVMLLTLGTAVAYRLKSTGKIVANCHKAPSASFDKELLSLEEVLRSLEELIGLIGQVNPEIRIIITVSPVRHIKDTLQLNSVSKSILRLASHLIAEKHSNVAEYFPSYEVMNDDLRDYRFYKDDLIHPTLFAEEYIWEKFSETYFTERTRQLINRWQDIKKRLDHKPFSTSGDQYLQFVRSTLAHLEELNKEIDCSREIAEAKRALMIF
jgi:hypothetical protein